ncbi:MAG: hypothetical protein OEZ68_09655 [Gammaproteobacteria bacterium]|nr:hypothetical protein [Gammaproteobacteria bacterium]MDH5801052.1 hypothetical protein [Gammaproteobacteria bacterium]
MAISDGKKVKPAADKLVRETFSMPVSDCRLIEKIRDRDPALTARSTKSEIVRAGIHVLSSMSDRDLEQTLTQIERLKTGRRRKS